MNLIKIKKDSLVTSFSIQQPGYGLDNEDSVLDIGRVVFLPKQLIKRIMAIKQLKHEGDNSTPPAAEVKNVQFNFHSSTLHGIVLNQAQQQLYILPH
jgi:hypothetical protein